MINNIQTILFDMDGVVVDSEKLHLQAMDLALKTFGIEISQAQLLEFVGRSDEAFFQYVYDEISKQESINTMLEEKNKQFDILHNDLQFVEGFSNFIKKVHALKLKTALVTSSSQYSVGRANEILNHTKLFDVVVCEESTTKHKPNPEPYLLGLSKTNSQASTSLVIEDSINGIIAGKAAGCTVIGLTTSFDKERLLKAGADYVANSYTEVEELAFLRFGKKYATSPIRGK